MSTTPDPIFQRHATGDYRSEDGSFRVLKNITIGDWTIQRHTENGWRKLQDGFDTLTRAQAWLADEYLR